ncbi:MAG TPA: methionyl-tRNA formyltransferase [Bacteroidia bacterium]|nr:methionyl-tRNA formyltransferase [Bacteroidia bacterium]
MQPDPKTVRIIFLGTPEFAACSLEKLVAEKYNVVAAITAPDKPAGRGQEIRQSEVKQVAVKHGIPVLQPEKLKSPEFLEELKSFDPELMIVVAFRMLPELVWSMPRMGTFNLHGSLLPQYRGAAPINRAVMNGEKLTGVTTFLLKQEIDTGSILLRKEIPIGENETAGELHDRMMVIGADLVTATVDALAEGTIQPVDQSHFVGEGEMLKDAPKLFRDTCRIDWSWPGERIRNHVRGLNPFPAAWSDLRRADGSVLSMKIFRCSFVPGEPFGKPGTINDQFHVAVSDGTIRVEEIQAPGKKRMNISEFLKGFRVTGEESFM